MALMKTANLIQPSEFTAWNVIKIKINRAVLQSVEIFTFQREEFTFDTEQKKMISCPYTIHVL